MEFILHFQLETIINIFGGINESNCFLRQPK
jgi:hypothetical protein